MAAHSRDVGSLERGWFEKKTSITPEIKLKAY